MTTTFPTSVDAFGLIVDGVTEIVAADINDLQDATMAVETYLLGTVDARFDVIEAAITAGVIGENLLYDTLCNDASWITGTAFSDAADDSYLGALWNALWATNAPDWSRQAGAATDPFESYLRCTHDANSQAGIVQFIEAKDAIPLRGKTVSISADLWGTNVSSLRMAVLERSGTADSLTSDVVGTWGTGNPTIDATWAYVGTPAQITITGTRTRYTVANLTLSSNITNLAVFIWTDVVEASGDLWNVARVKLEIGAAATDFMARPVVNELFLIGRYYQKTYDIGTALGTNTAVGAYRFQTRTAVAGSAAGTLAQSAILLQRMRTTPTVVLYSSVGTVNAVRNATAATDRTGATAASSGETSAFNNINISNASANAIALDDWIIFHFTADARL